MSETLKILIPFFTFSLGILSTILFKRLDKRKERLTKSLTEVLELVNSWYNQLHEIYFELKNNPDKESNSIPSKFTFYLNNRLLLPKLLHHLAILKRYKKADKTVSHVETFLSLVTNYQRHNSLFTIATKSKDSSVTTFSNTNCQEFISPNYSINTNISILDILLKDLDKELQTLSVEMVNIKN